MDVEEAFMRVTYSLTIEAKCPIDNEPDAYECEITSTRTIPVEEILDAVKELPKAFQEDVTVALARKLGATVQTIGWHSGIKTEVVA